MIILNGKKFAENEEEFINSLFQQGGTCVGYIKPYKKTIAILDHQKNKVGVITCNKVMARADKQNKGYWYSYGDIDIVGRYDSYAQQCDEIEATLDHFRIL